MLKMLKKYVLRGKVPWADARVAFFVVKYVVFGTLCQKDIQHLVSDSGRELTEALVMQACLKQLLGEMLDEASPCAILQSQSFAPAESMAMVIPIPYPCACPLACGSGHGHGQIAVKAIGRISRCTRSAAFCASRTQPLSLRSTQLLGFTELVGFRPTTR